jgi:SynChlorMet cassette protein ScmC
MDDPKIMPNRENGYGVHLANGQTWYLIAAKALSSWVEKLASIVELKICEPNGHPKLIFIRRESNREGRGEPTGSLDQNVLEDLPRNGWTAQNLGALLVWSHNEVPDAICEFGYEDHHNLDIIRMEVTLYPIYQRAQDSGGLPFHAALVGRNGIGVLLAAPGNGGKSTCCRRLPPPWHVLCDDETLIVREHQKQYSAHPFPTWSDYLWRGSERTWNVQRHLPLSAIFFLEQAETDQAVPVGQGQAATYINQLAAEVCHRNWRNLGREKEMSLKRKLFDNACELARAVPAFQLRVSQNGQFWEEMERVLV